MILRGVFCTALAALLVAAPVGCGEDEPDVTGVANFEVELPEGWSAQDDETLQDVGTGGLAITAKETGQTVDPSGVEFLAVWSGERADGFTTNVNVFREPLHGASPQRYIEFSEDQLAQVGAEVIERGEGSDVGGEPSQLLEYESSFQGSPTVRVRTLSLFRDDHAYNISLTTLPDEFDAAAAEFDRILSSWTWTE